MPRKIKQMKIELLKRSREAALAAVQIFNNPNITFKSETYIVLMIIAWTYLLHAYYGEKKIDYRYADKFGKNPKFMKTKHGSFKYWELGKCLKDSRSPIDRNTTNNLNFLIGLRHEIEHQMSAKIDDILGARFQACCLNYNKYIKKLFGSKYSIDSNLAFSLQFSSISQEQVKQLGEYEDLPENIKGYILSFDDALSHEEFNDPCFAHRVLFTPKIVNRKGQADRVIEFIRSDDPLAKGLHTEYAVIKETEKPKYRPSNIVKMMKEGGYKKFSMHKHTKLWKENDAKNPSKGFGISVAGDWYWYESWVKFVQKHCLQNKQELE